MRFRLFFLFVLFLLAFLAAPPVPPAGAEEARPLAADPVAEKRLQSIAGELRCLVCQNETIAASNADLAEDLRAKIRGMIGEGRSDDEILDFMVEHYGDFVLYRPPFKATTWLLWLGPPFFLIFGVVVLRLYLVRRARRLAAAPPPDDGALREAARLLAAGDGKQETGDGGNGA
ncbi:MAG: cytochrome c-type biogenesis protein CcmH [Zoogloeaceae bacterium]|jgi:cytochrome c-type biogenesis protein CcmH|nr:cytochrome c-type biogenesis protein CcmH [Zoogloeaceae bacterium]